uniref:TNFAIP3-interacting protein 3 n=1 Tax=Leptobrachium leishanense TaxID=445787 RepID=A0A8C5LNI4_9ANUR
MNIMSTEAYKQRIHILEKQRSEVLEVNKQWDQQFRKMKQNYEDKVAELKMKLSSSHQNTEENLLHKENQKSILDINNHFPHPSSPSAPSARLQEVKEENLLLRKQNSVFSRTAEHHESEINRLNKALLEAIHKDNSQTRPLCQNPLGKEDNYEEMITYIEVLKQQADEKKMGTNPGNSQLPAVCSKPASSRCAAEGEWYLIKARLQS